MYIKMVKMTFSEFRMLKDSQCKQDCAHLSTIDHDLCAGDLYSGR